MLLCTNCGYRSPDGSKFCIRCGTNLSTQPSPILCPSCGAPIVPRSTYCEICGKRIAPEVPAAQKSEQPASLKTLYPLPWEDGSNPRSVLREKGKSFWAGILLFAGGAVDIGNGFAAFFRDIPTNDLGVDVAGYVACCATLSIIFGSGAVLGGWLSITKKNFYAVLVGAVLGMLGIGFLGIGALICLIALILVAVSKDEYAG